MSANEKEAAEGLKVTAVGAIGSLATTSLSDVATLVSIGVGVATFAYVSAKIYFLFKNHGKSSD